MSRLGLVSLRIASAIAILVFLPAWHFNSTPGQARFSPVSQMESPATATSPSQTANSPTSANRLSTAYGKLPISFEVNQGQTDASVQFLARSAGYTLFLTPGEAVLSLHAPHGNATKPGAPSVPHALQSSAVKFASTAPPTAVRLQLIEANIAAKAVGVDPLPGKSNYFVSNNPAKWHTDVPTFAKVRYSNVYPGIDLLYYGNQEGKLEHDFVLAPGADPNLIAIGLRESAKPVADQNGDLTLHTKSGDLTLRSPVVYQVTAGHREIIPATYVLASNNQIKFHLGSYDKTASLVIDPVLQYSGVLGGNGDDVAASIAVDGSGNAYITGWTNSSDFPRVNSFQGSLPDPNADQSFLSKINAAGTALLYSTYLDNGRSSGIAVDSAGRAYVVGSGGSGFPLKNAHQSKYGGGASDMFLAVLNAPGNTLLFSTLLGGPGDDWANAIALDASDNAYVTGASGSGFPTLHSIQTQGSAFVAKFNVAGLLQYSSVFASGVTVPLAVAVDASASAYITGVTYETNFPIRNPAFQSTCLACPQQNGFVSKLSPSGSSLAYSTYLGAPGSNLGLAIAVDSSGNAYVAGDTLSGFPVTTNAFQKKIGGILDGFITKLNPSGSALIYSTYLGGSDNDEISGLALDKYRTVYVTGTTASSNFPLKASLQTYENDTQAFVTTLSSSGSSIAYYSTLIGEASSMHIALDKALNVYVVGSTSAGSISATPGALNKPGQSIDAFISKLVIADDLALGVSGSPSSVKHGTNLTYTIAVTSKGPDFGVNLHIDDTLPTGTTFVSDSAGGGTCTAPAVGATGSLHCVLPQLNKGQTYTVKLTAHVNAVAGTTLSNTATTTSGMQDLIPANNKGTLTTKVN
jgi:uncharacterized repeat protein (TIGR01451 family)